MTVKAKGTTTPPESQGENSLPVTSVEPSEKSTGRTVAPLNTSNGDSPKETGHSPHDSISGSSLSSKREQGNAQQPSHDDKRPELTRQTSRADGFSRLRIVVIMFSLCMALFLAALDVTIITTALPTIAGHFQASSAGYTWIGSAYLLANASSTPLWGKLSDIWGRKPVIIIANIIFMIGSLIAALAVSIGMLIGGRVVQGLGGGGLVILVNICISDLFSMRERPKYYGIVGMVWAIASGVGPVLGGVFTEEVSWRWCFYINLPLDGLSLVLLLVFLKLETPRTPLLAGIKAVDWVGVITIVGGVVCFLYGMESGGISHPWDSAFVLCLIIFGLVLIAIFFVNEWKLAKYPIMPLRLFKDPSNVAAFGVCFCHGFVFIAQSYYLPLYFQTVLTATPILSGVYLFALVISLSLCSMASGIFVKKTGQYLPLIWGALFFLTLGTGLLIDLPPYASWARIIIYQIIAGIGVGPLFQTPLIALQSHLRGYDVAVGTATFGFVRNIATSLSVVIGGVVFQNQLAGQQGRLERALGPQLARQFASSSFGSTTEQLRTLTPDQKAALNDAYTSSLRTMWIFYTAIAAFGILISFFITKKELSRDHEKTKTGIQEQERARKEQKELDAERKKTKGSKSGERDLER